MVPRLEEYRKKLVSREEALSHVRRGQRIFLGTGCGEPMALKEALVDRADELQDIQLLHFLTLTESNLPGGRFDARFRHNVFFVSPVTRDAINEAKADYTPVFMSDIPRHFRSGAIPVDVALIQVTPPDKWGYVSLGVSVDIVKAAVESAGLVIAQVNPNQPWTMGETYIPVNEIDYFVEQEEDIFQFPYPVPDETGRKIARRAAGLISDGDTIHIGYGQIPGAVLDYIDSRRHLGLHTEAINDAVCDLVEAGVIDGSAKSLHPGKAVGSFCLGTNRTYKFVDRNLNFQFMPADYTYSPAVISGNDNMISFGAALEIDFSGQVCSETKGLYFYSGIGGRLCFMRGAAMAKGGRSVICLPAASRDGFTSRIAPHLAEGAGVAATKGDIDFVVTEFGAVRLSGRSLRERAMALISIAHPKFRAELLAQAKARGYVYPDQIIVAAAGDDYPDWLAHKTEVKNGASVNIRPIGPTDESLLQQFFYSVSEETIFNRYFRPIQAMPHKDAQRLVNVDYVKETAVCATIGDLGRERIIGVARYAVDEDDNRAEIAVTVDDEYHGQGLGTILEFALARQARSMKLKGLTAYVLSSNKALHSLFGKLGPFRRKREEGDVFRLWIDFEDLSGPAEEATRPPLDGSDDERE